MQLKIMEDEQINLESLILLTFSNNFLGTPSPKFLPMSLTPKG